MRASTLQRRRALPLIAAAALICASLAGCASSGDRAPEPMTLPAFAGASSAKLSTDGGDDLLAIDESMRSFVGERLMAVENPTARMRELSRLLLESPDHALQYQGDLTLSARESFRQRSGNCLSITALMVALAREAGLDAAFEDVPVVPSWHLAGSAFVVERHVNALVFVDGRQYVFDFRPPSAAMYSGARRIDDANALAQYYGNLGVDRFAAGDLEGAYRYYQRGLDADQAATQLWINVGVVFVRNRQFDEAGRVYRHALELEPDNLSALNNLSLLEQQLGHGFTAQRYAKRVERYRSHNPYYRYWQGEQRLLASDAPGALQEFTSAVRMLPSEADFHFALARTYLALGDRSAAAASYGAALELASADSVRQRYRTEYDALTGGS